MHCVHVFVRDAARRRVGMKRAAVAVRGDAEARVVLQRGERRSLSRLGGQQLFPQRLQGERQRRSGDCAVGGDRHASGLEPGFAFGVGSRPALRGLQIHRPVDGVQFGQRRQPAFGPCLGSRCGSGRFDWER